MSLIMLKIYNVHGPENIPVKQYESLDLKQIAILQIKYFLPDIILFDDPDEALLRQIRDEVPSIRLVLAGLEVQSL